MNRVRLTPEQDELRAAVRGLLDRCAVGPDAADAAVHSLWQRLCTEIGVAGLAVPADLGGAGAGLVEVHVVMTELGRSLTPSPMLGSAVLATWALLATGDIAACRRLLPSLLDGSQTAALAWPAATGRWDPAELACRASVLSAGLADGDWAVTGEAHYVLDASQATVLLVAARTPDGRTALFDVPPDQPQVTRTPQASMDESRRFGVVRLEGAVGRPIGESAGLAAVRDAACIALSGEQVGAAAAALARTVAYAKVRVQFGRPIGSFQALQHRMADMHVLVESAGSLSHAAAQAVAAGAGDSGLRAAAAKAYCSEVFQRVAAEMIQLHGAMGMTWEHPAHRYFKRAHGAAMLLGPPASHVERIAAAVVDG